MLLCACGYVVNAPFSPRPIVNPVSMGIVTALCVAMVPGLCTEPSTFSGLNTFLSNDYILQFPALMLVSPKAVSWSVTSSPGLASSMYVRLYLSFRLRGP